MMVKILASGVQNRRLHVSQVHAFPGERAGAEGMVFQAGPDQRPLRETLAATKPRLVIQRWKKTAVFDGKEYCLTPQQHALLLALARDPSEYISGKDLKDTKSSGVRPRMIRQKLPGPLKSITDAAPGKGIMLDLKPSLVRVE